MSQLSEKRIAEHGGWNVVASPGDMSSKSAVATIREFGPFRLDAQAGLLFRAGEPTPLGHRAVTLLRTLLEQPGVPVSKNALIEAAWPGQTVEESNLTVQIAALRRVLAEVPGGERWIETLPRRGYRFVGPVSGKEAGGGAAAVAAAVASEPPRPSIVVMPFVNLTRDPLQESFVDGVTETLTTELSRMAGASIIARNTAYGYKGKSIDVKEIGRGLGVRYVVLGSIQVADERFRINAQLIDAETATCLWADRFDVVRGDVFDSQDEIVARLARSLNVELPAAELVRSERLGTHTPDSTDLMLRGWAQFNKLANAANWTAAATLFERALDLDPDNVEALAGKSIAHSYLAINWLTDHYAEHLRIAEAAATKALALAPNNAQAHHAMARVLAGTDRAELAIGECKRALQLERNLAPVHGLLAMCKRFTGWPEEAEEHARTAMRLSPRDPSAVGWYLQIGLAALQMRELDKAVIWLRRAIEADRNLLLPHVYLGSALALSGAIEEARAAIRAGLAIDPRFTMRRMLDAPMSSNRKTAEQYVAILEGMRKAGVPEG